MFVIPKPGLNFRDPHSLVRVPPEGMEVPDGSLEWARILADGDATLGEAPAAADPASTGKGKAQAGSATSEEG
jgi:hypothetical protein